MKKRSVFILILVVAVSIVAGVFVYQPFWQKYSSFRPWHLGLDLVGGSYLVYDVDTSGIIDVDEATIVEGLRDVIERRVNLFGVSEPRVYTKQVGSEHRLVVELAGILDINKAIQEIGETPVLDFREVRETEDGDVEYVLTELTGRYIQGAQVVLDQYTNKPMVSLELTGDGGDIFAEITGRNVGKPIAIFLDGEPITAPIVQEKIVGGRAQISGEFTLDEARMLVERFNAGALPAPITLVNQQTVSPSLGKDSIGKSLTAGLWGVFAIIVYMIFYYRKLGLFASAALVMYIALVLAIFKIIPITLTLSGIAGVILSIGMAVDANILVFERTREELKRGLPYAAAVEEGFRRAWSSIRDSNITTIISAVILYYFTTSFVQGFALALLIGVLVSMFSAITITRTLLRVFAKSEA